MNIPNTPGNAHLIQSIMDHAYPKDSPTNKSTTGPNQGAAQSPNQGPNILDRIIEANQLHVKKWSEGDLAEIANAMPDVIVKSLVMYLTLQNKYPNEQTMKTLVFLLGSWKAMGAAEQAIVLAKGWDWLWTNTEEFLRENPDADTAMSELVGKLERGEV